MESLGSQLDSAPVSVATGGGTKALERWAKFFGPPNFPLNPNPYDKYSVETYDLPEAYKGRNLFLRERIDELIRKGNDWYTTHALPWKSTNDIHVQWNEWHFTSTLAGRVPHEGISRLVSSSKRTFRDHVVRRGLALILEHGFMNTPEGEEQYIRSLLGIRQCVQETCNYDVIYAYLTCKNYEREWEAKFGIRNPEIIRTALDREVSRFAAVQKSEDGLDILHEELKSQLLQRGVSPDTWIFPPRMMMYITMVPPKSTEYYRGGEKAVERFERGPGARASFRGCDVYETRPFEVHENEPPVDLLVRPQQVGEYYRMLGKDFTVDPADYKTEHRDIIVYDEANDNWAKIGFRTALTRGLTVIYDRLKAGETAQFLGKQLSGKDAGAELTFDAIRKAAGSAEVATEIKSEIESILKAKKKTADEIDKYWKRTVNFAVDVSSNALLAAAVAGEPVPVGLLLFRPFITHYASSAILTVAGSSTGSTFVGHSDFQLGDDVASKLHYGTPVPWPLSPLSSRFADAPRSLYRQLYILLEEHRHQPQAGDRRREHLPPGLRGRQRRHLPPAIGPQRLRHRRRVPRLDHPDLCAVPRAGDLQGLRHPRQGQQLGHRREPHRPPRRHRRRQQELRPRQADRREQQVVRGQPRRLFQLKPPLQLDLLPGPPNDVPPEGGRGGRLGRRHREHRPPRRGRLPGVRQGPPRPDEVPPAAGLQPEQVRPARAEHRLRPTPPMGRPRPVSRPPAGKRRAPFPPIEPRAVFKRMGSLRFFVVDDFFVGEDVGAGGEVCGWGLGAQRSEVATRTGAGSLRRMASMSSRRRASVCTYRAVSNATTIAKRA